MASVVNLQVLYSGHSACFGLVGFSARISTYWLRGIAGLSSCGLPYARVICTSFGFATIVFATNASTLLW